jgi:hypothetical protein
MARRSRRSSRRLGSTVLGAVKVCKLKGKRLVCKSMRLGSTVLGRKPSRRRRMR